MSKRIVVILLVDFLLTLLCMILTAGAMYLDDRTLFDLGSFATMFVFVYLAGLSSLLGWYGRKMPRELMAISVASAALAGGGLGFVASGKPIGILVGSVAMMAIVFLSSLPRRFQDI